MRFVSTLDLDYFKPSVAHSLDRTYILMDGVYFRRGRILHFFAMIQVSVLCLFCGLRDSAKCRCDGSSACTRSSSPNMRYRALDYMRYYLLPLYGRLGHVGARFTQGAG
jgi:hypothetical protein